MSIKICLAEDFIIACKIILRQYGEVQTHETILEICLSDDMRSCDCSIRLDKQSKFGKEFWLELDFETCKDTKIQSCYFFDMLGIKTLADVEIACDKLFPEIADKKILNSLKPARI